MPFLARLRARRGSAPHRLQAALRLALAVLLLAPAAASAGAWPREAGTSFVLLRHEAGRAGADWTHWTTLFAEHGLGRGLTLGVDAGTNGRAAWQGLVFLRYGMTPGGGWQLGLEAGAGARSAGAAAAPEAVLRLGAALGRGFDTGWGPGWAEAEAQLLHAPASGWQVGKLTLTGGVDTGATKLMLQLEGQAGDDGTRLRLVPRAVRRIGPGLELGLGLAVDPARPRDARLSLGSWLQF